MNVVVDYLDPDVPPVLPWHDVPLKTATSNSLRGYGALVDHPAELPWRSSRGR